MPAPPLTFRGVYDALRWPTARDIVFSLKAYLAAVLAMLIGFSQDLENPYWGVLTVYILLTPPESGAIRSKALFRLGGAAVGGALIIAVTGVFGDQLGVLISLILIIIVAATYLRLLIRTPANYFFFSVGVTAGIAGLANLMQATHMFDYATARVGEISLGILCIAAVDSLLWPRPMTHDFLDTMARWQSDARAWVIDAIKLTEQPFVDEERRRAVRAQLRELTRAFDTIDAKAIQLPFDIVPSAPRGAQINITRAKVAALIADLAGIETWIRPLRRSEIIHAHLARVFDEMIAWLSDEHTAPDDRSAHHLARGETLARRLEATRASIDTSGGRAELIERGLLSRLIGFVDNWCDLIRALQSISSGRTLPTDLRREARISKPVRSTDYLKGAFDVAPIALSTAFTASLWYATAWSAGTGALLFSFLGCVFLLGQGSILRSGNGLVFWILMSFALVFLYQFAILPRVTTFPTLVIAFGLLLIPCGILMAMSSAGMLLCVYSFSFLGLQNAYAADFNQSLQTLASSLAGLLIAITSLYLCSYDRARFTSRRLLAAVRRDIVDVARTRHLPDRRRFLFLTVDRLGLYFTAAQQSAGDAPLPRLRLLDDFRIGMNLLLLREHERTISAGVGDRIAALRGATAAAYRSRASDIHSDGSLLAHVDAAIDDPAVRAEPASEHLLEALIGMRLALSDDHSLRPSGPIPHDS